MKLYVQKEMHSKTNVEIIPLFKGKLEENRCAKGDNIVKKLADHNLFKGDFGQVYAHTKEIEDGFKYIIYLGLGEEEKLTTEKIRVAISKALKKVKELKENRIHIKLIKTEKLSVEEIIKATFEGAAFTNYKFDKYKTTKKEDNSVIEEIGITAIGEENLEKGQKALKEAEALIEGTIIARDLVNEPANVMYPETLAQRAVEIGKESGFEVEVFDKDKIESLEMKAYLEVAKASEKEPKFIIMRYFGDEDNKENIFGLVGKGLTYDAGGYSIKSTAGMTTMKSDMGGSAAVIGAMSVIAKMKLKVNVVTVVAACENMISGGAYKPGDIIGSMAGKTIEVLNTDAEGRLTLVDAVNYIIEKENVNKVVDIATLTGAALAALGTTTTPVVTNNEEFFAQLKVASETSGEKIWQLPAFDEYKQLIKSDIADLKNTGGKYAGTITAGLFIGEFVQGKPWLHLDIAGTSWTDASKDYSTKGATGAGVRILYYLIKQQ